MLTLAAKKIRDYPNFSVKQMDVLDLNFKAQFDGILSFWCLHWCKDLPRAFNNIFHALKEGGKLLVIIPSGKCDDPFMMNYMRVKESGIFPCLNDFKPLVDFKKVAELPSILATLPFKDTQVDTVKESITLPSLDYFRKFVNGLAFFQGQIPVSQIHDVNEALTQSYHEFCQAHFNGEYRFNITIFIIKAEK